MPSLHIAMIATNNYKKGNCRGENVNFSLGKVVRKSVGKKLWLATFLSLGET